MYDLSVMYVVERLYRITMEKPSQTTPGYQAMAELRYQIRCFLRFSEQAARSAGLEPQHHQFLLALKGLPAGKKPTITVLAERLQIQHHSAVELVDRLAGRRLVRRYRSRTDRRQVFVRLTQSGEEVLRRLSLHHLHEYRSVGPALAQLLNAVIAAANKSEPLGEPLRGDAEKVDDTRDTDQRKAKG